MKSLLACALSRHCLNGKYGNDVISQVKAVVTGRESPGGKHRFIYSRVATCATAQTPSPLMGPLPIMLCFLFFYGSAFLITHFLLCRRSVCPLYVYIWTLLLCAHTTCSPCAPVHPLRLGSKGKGRGRPCVHCTAVPMYAEAAAFRNHDRQLVTAAVKQGLRLPAAAAHLSSPRYRSQAPPTASSSSSSPQSLLLPFLHSHLFVQLASDSTFLASWAFSLFLPPSLSPSLSPSFPPLFPPPLALSMCAFVCVHAVQLD